MTNFNGHSSVVDNEEIALSEYEQELERMINENLANGQDLYTQKLFIGFQNAAKAVTKMFRERSNGTTNWNSFHAAAGSVTMLYKESLDALKDATQLGITTGEQRKTKDLLYWTRRKQRRHIRTDEVNNYLIDQPSINSLLTTKMSNTNILIVEDLQTFREALVVDDVSSYRPQSEQLENFVREQVADQLARKRDYHSTDSLTTDSQKAKRVRHS